MPLNIVLMLFAMYLMPKIGYGPIWKTYEEVMAPCSDYWWTNVLFVNNFYPSSFDDKCLPWNWFLPVYIQLSLILPLLLALYLYLPLLGSVIAYTILALVGFALNLSLIITKDLGATPAFND